MSYQIVGQSTPRTDNTGKVTGEARYTSDVLLPGTLWAKTLRSPYSHARIKHIDTSRAEKASGVRAVLTAFPDWQVTIEELVAEGDLVVDRFTIRATHTGSVNGITPTGQQIAALGMHMWRLAGGKLVEGWYVTDALPQVAAALTPTPSRP